MRFHIALLVSVLVACAYFPKGGEAVIGQVPDYTPPLTANYQSIPPAAYNVDKRGEGAILYSKNEEADRLLHLMSEEKKRIKAELDNLANGKYPGLSAAHGAGAGAVAGGPSHGNTYAVPGYGQPGANPNAGYGVSQSHNPQYGAPGVPGNTYPQYGAGSSGNAYPHHGPSSVTGSVYPQYGNAGAGVQHTSNYAFGNTGLPGAQSMDQNFLNHQGLGQGHAPFSGQGVYAGVHYTIGYKNGDSSGSDSSSGKKKKKNKSRKVSVKVDKYDQEGRKVTKETRKQIKKFLESQAVAGNYNPIPQI